MEQILLPLLPIVGGYRFACEWRASIYLVAYENDQRIYMRAVFYGASLFFGAAAAWLTLRQGWEVGAQLLDAPTTVSLSAEHLRMETSELFVIATVTLLGAKYFARFLNGLSVLRRYYDEELRTQIRTNEFAYLLFRAMPDVLPVMLSMRSGKVYVGVVTSSVSNLEAVEYIGIIPVVSGFRNAKHEVEFTTDYSTTIKMLQKRDGDANALVKVIPVNEIVSSNLFDFKAYQQFLTTGAIRGSSRTATAAPAPSGP